MSYTSTAQDFSLQANSNRFAGTGMIEEGLKFEQKGYNYVTFTKPTPQSHAPPAAQPAAAAPVSDASAQQEKPYIAPLNLPNSRGLKAGAAGASENAHVYASQSAPFATDDQTHASAKRQYTKIVPSQAHYELHPELVAEVKNRAYKPKLLDLNQPSKDKPAYSLPRRFNDPSTMNHKSSNQHPLYRTASNQIGYRQADIHEMPNHYFAVKKNFSDTFRGGMYRDYGLNTSLSRSRVKKHEDFGFY